MHAIRRGMLWTGLALAAHLVLAGCAARSAPQPVRLTAPAPPEWHVGDRWRHSWTAGKEKGIKTSEVTDIRETGAAKLYVLRVGNASGYYSMDLHWAGATIDGRVIGRSEPPRPWFLWPLEAGRRWDYQGTYEDQEQKTQVREAYEVRSEEAMQVPAGTFRTLHVVRESGAERDEYWYAPEVGWYVKWRGRRGAQEFEELLLEFTRGSGVPPKSSPPRSRP